MEQTDELLLVLLVAVTAVRLEKERKKVFLATIVDQMKLKRDSQRKKIMK